MGFILLPVYVRDIEAFEPFSIDAYDIEEMYINTDLIATVRQSELFDHEVTEIGINGELFDSPMHINDVLKAINSGGDVQSIFLN